MGRGERTLGSAARGSRFGIWPFVRVRGQPGQMRWCKGDADKGGRPPVPPHALLGGRGPAPPRAPSPHAPLLACSVSTSSTCPSPLHPLTTRPPHPPPAIRRPSRRPARVRPRHQDLDAALGRGRRPPSVCQRRTRLHVGGGPALRARGVRHHGRGWKHR